MGTLVVTSKRLGGFELEERGKLNPSLLQGLRPVPNWNNGFWHPKIGFRCSESYIAYCQQNPDTVKESRTEL